MEKYISQTPLLLGAFSAMSLTLSVIFDLGYFSIVGPRYFLLMELGDHLNSLVLWLPTLLLLGACIYLAFWMVISTFRAGRHGAGSAALRRTFLNRVFKEIAIALSILTILAFFYIAVRMSFFMAAGVNDVPADIAKNLSVSFILLGGTLVAGFISYLTSLFLRVDSIPRLPAVVDAKTVLVVAGIVIALGFYSFGRVIATHDLSGNGARYDISYAVNEVARECTKCALLRSFSRGAIIFDDENRLLFSVPQSSLLAVKRPIADAELDTGIFGWIFDFPERPNRVKSDT